MRPGSRTKISVPLVLPQNRLPERSASQTNRVTQRLWRAVEGPSALLISPMRFGAFQPSESDNKFCCDTHWMRHTYIFSCTVIIFRPQLCARFLKSGRWLKSSEPHG